LDRVPVEPLDGETTDVINAVGFKEKGVKQILRQATSALTESETMWKELITQLQDGQQTTGQQVFEQFAVQIFDPNDPSKVINKRPLQRLASLMGVTKKQARMVAEVFNPNHFGPETGKFGLEKGVAFDLTLGHDLLKSKSRSEVRQYINNVKPGCVVVSSPCTMFSVLQNLNQKHLEDPLKEKEFVRRLIEAKVLLSFACEICQLVRSYGGTFVFEHPLTSRAWSESKVQQLANYSDSILVRNDQCMFNLRSPEGDRYRKPTGWITNNVTVANRISRTCDHKHEHIPVFGNGPGGSRAKQAQEYPPDLVHAILGAYSDSIVQKNNLRHQVQLVSLDNILDEIYHTEYVISHSFLKDSHETFATDHPEEDVVHEENAAPEEHLVPAEEETVEERQEETEVGRRLPRERPLGLQHLVRRAHCGLGHIGNDKLARILQSAGVKKEAVEIAKKLTCDICLRHRKVAPARAAAPPKELHPNQIVGVDTVYLPGLTPGGKLRMALNILDWATRFQLIVPLDDHTPRSATRALYQWIRIFGPPERIYSDLGKEFNGCFQHMMDRESIVMDPGSLETPTQRSLTERAGKSFKEIFAKTLMDVACTTWEEWREAVDVTNATINRLTNKSGFSPVQRMLGYSPRIPGTNLSGGFNDHATASRYHAGDLQVQRAINLRRAAATAYHQADCDQALRNALHAGSRKWHHYEVGQTVYYWRKGMQQAKKDNTSFWHGPAKVTLTSLPTTVWVAHRGRIVKASPEHLRPAAEEEKFILTEWVQEIVETKKQLKETDFKGYIVLDERPPPEEMELDDEEFIPPPAPKYRLTGKHAASEVEFKPDEYDQKRQKLQDAMEARQGVQLGPHHDQHAEVQPGPEGGIFNDPDIEEEAESPGVVPTSPLPDDEIEEEKTEETAPGVPQEELHRGQVRRAEEPGDAEPPAKRLRAELLEIFFQELEKINMTRNRKEVNYGKLMSGSKKKFDKAISKEIQNNLKSGAYEALSREESEKIRREKSDLIMKSRYVLTEKAVEPHEVETLKQEGLLLEEMNGEMLKAKARHVRGQCREPGVDHSTSSQGLRDVYPADAGESPMDYRPFGLHTGLPLW
jgi:hypothetical protein